MKVAHLFCREGWRRLGVFNIILASLCGVSILTVFSIAVVHYEGNSTFGPTTIKSGRCDDILMISNVLHALINIISTGILASSNFFMQIVTSPTRKEVDQAHMFLRPLSIGLPSWRNLSSLPPFKKACWLLLFLSSIPIHLFFNSAVYKTAYQGDHFNLTIATAAFTQSDQHWLPGASLAPAGASSPVQVLSKDPTTSHYRNPYPYNKTSIEGYGNPVSLQDYWDEPGIRPIIKQISQQASKWERLSFAQCMAEYRADRLLSKYSDLLIIVSSETNNGTGWQRDQIFEFDPDTNLREFWDLHVPPEAINPLWYWTTCRITANFSNNCDQILTMPRSFQENPADTSPPPNIRFDHEGQDNTTAAEKSHGYSAIQKELKIESYLAKPAECRIMVSSGLLLIVMSCVLVKVTTCIAILWCQQDASLITPGDAIESFVSKPDLYTRGLASLDLTDSRNLQCSARREPVSPLDDNCSAIRPRGWQATPRRLYSTITNGAWIQIYYPTSIALVGVGVGLAISFFSSETVSATFGPSDNVQVVDFLQDLGYYGTLIALNTPQLILSFIYLIVNMLHTQLQVEREWNSYALAYKPLRVSFPRGKQTSTYRLQLPYRYSIPLMATSTALHWMVSNCLFIVIVDGNTSVYPTNDRLREAFDTSEGVSAVAGYSVTAIAAVFFCGAAFVLSPLLFSSRMLDGDMTFGATDSLVLSAACHVPRAASHIRNRCMDTPEPVPDVPSMGNRGNSSALSLVTEYGPIQNDGASTTHSPLVDSEHELDELAQIEDEEEYRIAVSRLPLRWGVTSLPQELERELLIEDDEPVMHLSFGTEDHDVGEPHFSALYA